MNTVHFGEATAPQIPTPNAIPPLSPLPPQKHFSWQWHKWVLVGIAVLTFSLAVAYLANRPQLLTQTQSPKPTQPPQITQTTLTPTPDPTANWKTYESEKLSFSVKYPPYLRVQFSNDKVVFFVLKEGDTQGIGVIVVEGSDKEDLENELVTLKKDIATGKEDIIRLEETEMDGNKVYKIENSTTFSTVINKDNKMYSISADKNEELVMIFNQILSTFKFLE